MENVKREKSGGRQKGSLNKTTDKQRKRILWLLSLSEKRIESDMAKLSPKENIKVWTGLQQYLLPKLGIEKIDKEQDGEPQKVQITREIVYRALSEKEIETGSWKND